LGKLLVLDTQRQGEVHVHRSKLSDGRAPEVGEAVRVAVNAARRANIQRHHTVTHLFHWALHEVVSKEARQRGSHVAPDRMRFDFNHPEKLSDQQIADIERLVNERIKENAPVYWNEVPYAEIKGNPHIQQFFGEKYGDIVRVIQIGGHAGKFDGFSVELCGGTHTRNTGDIQFFKIAKESAIAAGTRRVEAVVGQFAVEFVEKMKAQQQAEAAKAASREQEKELARQRQAEAQKQAAGLSDQLMAKAQEVGGVKCIVANVGETTPDALRTIVDGIKPKLSSGVVVLGGTGAGKVSLVCFVTPDLVKAGKNAGKIVGALAKICGGGGGGRPDMAQAGGKEPAKLDEALRAVGGLL
jgi:alanyl-tRNA synthetase